MMFLHCCRHTSNKSIGCEERKNPDLDACKQGQGNKTVLPGDHGRGIGQEVRKKPERGMPCALAVKPWIYDLKM